MAQVVTVTEVCDPHHARGEEIPGKTHTIIIDGEAFEIETCGRCDGEHLAPHVKPLLRFLKQHGRPVANGKSSPAIPAQPLANVGTATVHELPVASSSAKPKAVATGNGKGGRQSSKPRRYPCLWCDLTFTTSTGMMIHLDKTHSMPKSVVEVFGLRCPLCGTDAELKLGVHLQSRHHGLTVPEAFVRARNEGDRHGVVGPVLAKVAK